MSGSVANIVSLFVVTANGKVLCSAKNGSWIEFIDKANSSLSVKRISCSSNSLWAIGHDHKAYVCIRSYNSIIATEEAYENERWTPVHGYSDRLLPTDRQHYSSKDGCTNRDLDTIQLPSDAWVWVGEWQLELVYNNEKLDQGWTYAFDFPHTFYASKFSNAWVRRRRWIRQRRFHATQQWVQLPSTSNISFIDIAAGGRGLEGASDGFVSVWAVSQKGSIYHRENVDLSTCPEGTNWRKFDTPFKVIRVSVQPNGIVSILTETGQLFARQGISWENKVGTEWVEIARPAQSIQFDHVTLVRDSLAWLVSQTNQVWLKIGADWTSLKSGRQLVCTDDNGHGYRLVLRGDKVHLRIGIKDYATRSLLQANGEPFTCLAYDHADDGSVQLYIGGSVSDDKPLTNEVFIELQLNCKDKLD